jgi:GTP-binding protein
VCKRCIQRLSRRHASTRPNAGDSGIEQHATRLNNGVTWEGMHFRKQKIDESEVKAKWSASNILVGKEARRVTVGPTEIRKHMSFGASVEVPMEAPRPRGRIRAGRARIPGAIATEILEGKDQFPVRLVPSVPSAQLGSAKGPGVNKPREQNQAVPISKIVGLSDNDFNWYWETHEPSYKDKAYADTFFLKNRNQPKLLRSVARFMEVPESDVPEVAFVGRSNVGKSSLLNAIVDANIKDLLARTSATRGFTKTMNFYGIGHGTGIMLKKDAQGRDKITGSGLVLVDMPGYGDGSLLSWGVEIMKYLQSRKQLRRVFVLLDAEHGIKEKDRSLLATLRLAGVSHQVILSKMDKVYIPGGKKEVRNASKPGQNIKRRGSTQKIREMMEDIKEDINPPVGGGALGEILACSSDTLVNGKRLGLDHVRYAVLKAAGLDKPGEKRQSWR